MTSRTFWGNEALRELREKLGDKEFNRQYGIIKKVLTKPYRGRPARPQASLMDEARVHHDADYDEYGEYGVEYGFLGIDLTDEEIEDMVEDMRMVICSPYDCTGQLFTRWIDVHKNPSGLVSFVHYFGRDI